MDIKIFEGEHEFLSNFYETPVKYGYVYGNSEAAYQAQKTLNFNEAIKFTKYPPGKAKRKGRKLELRPDWEEIKISVMRDIVFAKFFQHPELAAQLLATGDANLIEGNYWHDIFWGSDSETGEGKNNLGKILMAIRAELKNPELKLLSVQDVWITRFTLPIKTKFQWSSPKDKPVDLEFERRYDFEPKSKNHGITDCTWHLHDRTFTDLNFRTGELLKTLYDEHDTVQKIMAYDDGKKFFYQSNNIPVFDSGDALWDSINEFVIFLDEAGVNLIRSQHGWNIPAISIYTGLKNSPPTLEKILQENFSPV